MTLETQRHIDRWIGMPLCFLLGLVVRVLDLVRAHGPTEHPPRDRNVLFVELSEMGSTILAAAAIRRVQELNPNGRHAFVIFRRNAPSLRLLGLFDESRIFTIRDEAIGTMLVDLARFVLFCRRVGVDTTIDLELFARVSSLLSMVSGARVRVGFHNYRGEGLYRGEHLTHRVHYNPYLHMSQNFLALVEALDCAPTDLPMPKRVIRAIPPPVRIGVDQEAYDHVRTELLRLFPLAPHHRLVVVNHDAGALIPLRTWPVDRWCELVRGLLDSHPDLVVVLIGVADGAPSARRIATAVGDARCVDFVGRTRTLTDVIQLFHQAELLISNDSGPPHFAALTAVKTITLFGPETPVLYAPLGDHAVTPYAGLACSPCLTALNHRNSPCRDNKCLQAIPVAEVLGHSLRLLGVDGDLRTMGGARPSTGVAAGSLGGAPRTAAPSR